MGIWKHTCHRVGSNKCKACQDNERVKRDREGRENLKRVVIAWDEVSVFL